MLDIIAKLIFTENGKLIKKIAIPASQKVQILVGRKATSHPNTVILNHNTISSEHALISNDENGTIFLLDLNSSNGTYLNNKRLEKGAKHEITIGDTIGFAGSSPFKVEIIATDAEYLEKVVRTPASQPQCVTYNLINLLKTKDRIVVGRATGADVYFDDMEVSRHHAEIFNEGGSIWIQDLGSTNGTYVNNKRIKGKVKLSETDSLQIGVYCFNLNEDISPDEIWTQTAVRAIKVEKTYRGNTAPAIKPMTFEIPHKSFVALMGPSGCGKTTLMNALNGSNPASAGSVYIHGLELKQNYQVLKRKIGYVPQDDIVHKELTVYKSLFYAAKLKLPADISDDEINNRIDEVLASLHISDKKDAKVGALSGGQRKRVSIAVELLSKPKILFLDEPTSPLDPETIKDFLTAIKNLTNEGTTVIMVTHKPDDLEYVDRVIFLGTKGNQAFYGDKAQLQPYFRENFKAESILDIYAAIGPENVKQAQQAYQLWCTTNKTETLHENKSEIEPDKKESFFRQYLWLTIRYLNIKTNDRINTAILISQAPIIALLTCWIFKDIMLPVPFMMAISAIWFGASNAAREIVGELPIYKRERMYNMQIFSYILSKLTVLTLFSAIQAVLFVAILLLVYGNRDASMLELSHPSMAIGFMILVAFAATTMGLLMSALVNTTEKVMTLIPIVLIPQIMLAGVITKIESSEVEYISYVTISRWGTEGFCNIQERIVQPVYEPNFDTKSIQKNDSTATDSISFTLEHDIFDAVKHENYGIVHQFHPDYSKGTPFGNLSGTLKLDIIMLCILAALFLISTIVALRKKDVV